VDKGGRSAVDGDFQIKGGIPVIKYHVSSLEVVELACDRMLEIKEQQLRCTKGCYGWYIESSDLGKLDPRNTKVSRRIFLYIGTVRDTPQSSVTSRFLSELCGPQLSTDRGMSLDTDFVVSIILAMLSDRGVDVHFALLSRKAGTTEEVRLARQKNPILQRVTDRRVSLYPDLRLGMGGGAFDNAGNEVLEAFTTRLRGALLDDG
jgi:hypothetical protein